MAIGFGTRQAKSMSFGATAIKSMWFGNIQFYPSGGSDYINLPNTGATVLTGSTYAYISNITASTTAWTVESNSTSWLTVEKTSNTQAKYTVTANQGSTERNGTLSFKIGGITYATYEVRQTAQTYVFSRLTTSPVNIQSASTSFQISIVSTHNGSSLQPQVSITYDQMNTVLQAEVEGGGVGQWNYSFSCDRNNSMTGRTATIQFTQPGSQNTLGYTINQAGKPQVTPVSGFTIYQTYGDWALGTYVASYQDMGQYTHQPIRTISIMREAQPTKNYTADYNLRYQYGVPGPSQTSTTAGTRTITSSDVINIPSGGTGYGINIGGGPNLYITSVSGFTVT